MQMHPVPDMGARDGLAVEHMLDCTRAVLGADQRDDQIQLRAGIDDPSDAAQHSIHFAERAESIDVNGRKARGLQDQFRIVHMHPRNKLVASLGLAYVGNMTATTRNRALASSRFFARDQWSKLNTIPFGECSTVVTAPQLLSQVATVDANSSSCGEALGDESKQPSMALRLTPPRPQDSFSINSIPDIARRAA